MLFLDDYLKADDFAARVAVLGRELRQSLGLPDFHQLGIVVPDAATAAMRLESSGLRPFFIADGAPKLWREHGRERDVRTKLAVGYKSDIELELLEPLKGSEFYHPSVAPDGRAVIHHVGIIVSDLASETLRFESAGYPLLVQGRVKIGPVKAEFGYFDTVADAGLVTELMTWRILGIRFRPSPWFVRLLGRLETWSGKRSVSI